jgi:hypothetical protein
VMSDGHGRHCKTSYKYNLHTFMITAVNFTVRLMHVHGHVWYKKYRTN